MNKYYANIFLLSVNAVLLDLTCGFHYGVCTDMHSLFFCCENLDVWHSADATNSAGPKAEVLHQSNTICCSRLPTRT